MFTGWQQVFEILELRKEINMFGYSRYKREKVVSVAVFVMGKHQNKKKKIGLLAATRHG